MSENPSAPRGGSWSIPNTLTGLASPPVEPRNVCVVRDVGAERPAVYPVRLLYAGIKDGIHYWRIYWHRWLEPGDSITSAPLPPNTAICEATS